MLVYDITSSESFSKISDWMKQVKEYFDPTIPVTLVGNKIDLEKNRDVETRDAEKIANEWGIMFAEVSALDATNIESMFKNIATKAVREKSLKMDVPSNKVTLKANSKNAGSNRNKSGCKC
mmetsp:Transcript_39464/g.45318  ORF Transcript_39464/g.45318 Transcript_39464/m.45318 type:complete len:121 (-) Transcript_39464:47-409(-)